MTHFEFTTPSVHYPHGIGVTIGIHGERVRCFDADDVAFGESHVKFMQRPKGSDPAYSRSKVMMAVQNHLVIELHRLEECTQNKELVDYGKI